MDIVCFSSVVKWDFPVHLQSAIKMQPILGTLRQAVSQRWFLLDSAEVWSLNCWRILSQLPAAASCWDPWVLDKKNHKVRQESCLFQHLTYEHSSNYDWIYSWMLSWETHGLYNQMHLLPARLKSSMMWCGCLRFFSRYLGQHPAITSCYSWDSSPLNMSSWQDSIFSLFPACCRRFSVPALQRWIANIFICCIY